MIVIELKDDSAGLNNEKDISIVKSKSSLNQQQVEGYIQNEEVWSILFLPGFPSADQLTDASGRGDRMDSAQATAAKPGGTIQMNTMQGKGSFFLIQIPV